jgi:hypothetical protein
MRNLSILLLLLSLPACGGGDNTTPDAMPTADAMVFERLAAEINNAAVCGGQFTEKMTAFYDEGRNSLVVSGSCTAGSDDVYLMFSPYDDGIDVPCFQATVRKDDGTSVTCRENNQQNPAPEGTATVSDGRAVGTCTCLSPDDTAETEFDLLLQ